MKMNGGKSDASTSTDDVKGPPLCLFYFTHPFGVVSPEPPSVRPAPPHFARAFFDVPPSSFDGPAAPFYWAPPPGGAERPLAWRAAPGPRTLPPLRLAAPPRAPEPPSPDAWPRRPERLSLPPLERAAASARSPAPRARELRRRAVRKLRRRRADVRRLRATLLRRARALTEQRRGAAGPSPALRRVLAALADARPLHHSGAGSVAPRERSADTDTMTSPAPAPRRRPPPPARRYSLPETIMRRYRLSQRRPDTDESGAAPSTAASVSASPSRDDSPQRFLRRDRELMRKSALLRRMWARPCSCRDSRSLDGSRAELRRVSPLPPDAAPAPPSPPDDHLSPAADAGRVGGGGESPQSAEPAPPSSERLSEPTGLERDSGRSTFDADRRIGDRSRFDSDAFSTSASTAKATDGSSDAFLCGDGPLSVDGPNDARSSENYVGEDIDGRDECRPPIADFAAAHRFDVLEIVVSETVDRRDSGGGFYPATSTGSSRVADARELDVDEYVSNVLVESLNSLSDRLECVNASIGRDGRISVVEKEIKVKLQNAGVNTIVHLSPTSNHQIIFGNEELCHDGRRSLAADERDGPPSVTIREEAPGGDSDDEPRALAAAAPPFVSLLRHDRVDGAVLRQIQALFRDGLRDLDRGDRTPDAALGISRVHISDVDVYVDGRDDAARTDSGARAAGERIGGVGAGNYFRDDADAVAVPRFSAYPHTDSMEVNASSSEDAGAACSECASLVDSLDDPASPRYRAGAPRTPRRVELAPERAGRRDDDRAEAFFVRFRDDVRDRPTVTDDDVTVAEYMPETIRQRLHRRHRKREQRMECARRSKVKQLKRELERRRRDDAARDCAALVEALLDDVIAALARDECARAHDLRRDADEREAAVRHAANVRRPSNGSSERRRALAEPPPRPSAGDRPPRRVYQKSEIREGEKCIEILEILECANGSPSSPETSNSDENHGRSSARKKSRIPVPVNEKPPVERGDGRRSSAPPPPEPRSRSDSLRFKRVFDMIPEERSLSAESVCEEARATRSAATSPVAPRERRRSATTMTSPRTSCAATSPPPPPRAGGAPAARRGVDGSSGSSAESSRSLHGSQAPRWLAPRRRGRRAAPAPPARAPAGGWSVTVAGSCRAALPHDVEMRLRFPHEGPASGACAACSCARCEDARPERLRAASAAPPRALSPPREPALTLTVKKEAQEASVSGARRSSQLPELETYGAARTKLKSSVKTRRACSLHCWLPDDDVPPIRVSNGLSVLGCAIVPELKPRARTMSQRDLTRHLLPP